MPPSSWNPATLLPAVSAAMLLAVVGCRPSPQATPDVSADGPITNYTVRGVVRSLKPEEKTVVVRHEEIPGYMMAMTMPLAVLDVAELDGVRPGDGIQFRMRVTASDGWIDQIEVISNAPPDAPEAAQAPPGFRVLPNVPELEPGAAIPNYAFTNQFGQRFDLESLRGQAVAVTFIFTRCPYPLFCPRMSDHFAQVQRLMSADADGPANWRLISLTFDPEYDTPETMRAYGARWNANPEHWILATGALDQIEPFAISSGLYFGRDVDVANMNHNLRTLVINPDGRLREILVGNEWTPTELAASLKAASSPEP